MLVAGEEEIFCFSSSEVCRVVEIEVVTCPTDEDVQTTVTVECIYLVFT